MIAFLGVSFLMLSDMINSGDIGFQLFVGVLWATICLMFFGTAYKELIYKAGIYSQIRQVSEAEAVRNISITDFEAVGDSPSYRSYKLRTPMC